MIRKITIAHNEEIVCPNCGHHFLLDQGITRQTIERYEEEFERSVAAQKQELEIQLPDGEKQDIQSEVSFLIKNLFYRVCLL